MKVALKSLVVLTVTLFKKILWLRNLALLCLDLVIDSTMLLDFSAMELCLNVEMKYG